MRQPIEPGILKIFRWYVGIRLGLLLLLALANRGDQPPEPAQFPATGIVLFGLLFLVLMWPAVERGLGRFFLPISIVLATVAPIADAVANIRGRLEVGVSPNDALADYWLPFFLLFIPFIVTAWQYRYRWVVVFAVSSTLFEVVALTAVFPQDETNLAILGALLAARGLLLAFLGFFISKLVARQRDLRVELERQAVVREQLATGRERNRLARELHDTLAHSMTATAIQLEAAQALWDQDAERAKEHVERALAGTRSGLSEARRAIEALRASPIEEFGFEGALEWLAGETTSTSGVPIQTEVDATVAPAPPEVEQAVFRVAEEAINNAVEHGNASQIALTLETDEEIMRLVVSDNGSGFDPEGSYPGHHGITGMRERADMIGGVLEIDSSPVGTKVTLTVPT